MVRSDHDAYAVILCLNQTDHLRLNPSEVSAACGLSLVRFGLHASSMQRIRWGRTGARGGGRGGIPNSSCPMPKRVRVAYKLLYVYSACLSQSSTTNRRLLGAQESVLVSTTLYSGGTGLTCAELPDEYPPD